MYNYWVDPADPDASDDGAFTYTDGDASGTTHTQTYGWNHTVAETLNALIGAGLRIDRMEEQQGLDWEFLDSAVFEDPHWFFPEPLRRRIPTSFSLWATRL